MTIHFLARSQRRAACVLAAGVIVFAISSASEVAFAQPSEADRAAGEALFRDAKTLVDAGDFDAACPKFTESLARLPSASTAIHVARCRVHFAALQEGLDLYDRAITLNDATEGADRQAAIAEIAKRERDELLARIAKASPPPDTSAQPTPTSTDAPTTQIATPATEAPKNGDSIASSSTNGGSSGASPTQAPTGTSLNPPTPNAGSPTWPWIVGATGVAAIGIGVGLLIDSRLAASALDDCRTYGVDGDLGFCSTDSYSTAEDIQSDIDRANIGLGVSIPLLIAGTASVGIAVAGLALAPSAKSSATAVRVLPIMSTDLGAVVVEGRF